MKIIIAIIIKNEIRNENLINYYIIINDKYFNRNYCEIDKKKIINYIINNRIIVIIYKIINLNFDNFD